MKPNHSLQIIDQPIMAMRNLLLFATMTMLLIACKKGSDLTPPTATSQWTFNGATYKVTNGSYESYSNELLANDDAGKVGGGNFVRILFGAITKPTTSITLKVVDITATSNPSNCVIQTGNVYDASHPLGYLSTGKAGDIVTLHVSKAGMLTATFSNIVVSGYDGTTSKTVSGTLIEQ